MRMMMEYKCTPIDFVLAFLVFNGCFHVFLHPLPNRALGGGSVFKWPDLVATI